MQPPGPAAPIPPPAHSQAPAAGADWPRQSRRNRLRVPAPHQLPSWEDRIDCCSRPGSRSSVAAQKKEREREPAPGQTLLAAAAAAPAESDTKGPRAASERSSSSAVRCCVQRLPSRRVHPEYIAHPHQSLQPPPLPPLRRPLLSFPSAARVLPAPPSLAPSPLAFDSPYHLNRARRAQPLCQPRPSVPSQRRPAAPSRAKLDPSRPARAATKGPPCPLRAPP